MKKIVSLLLALVMTLSLCVPAYAGSTAGTVALRLTGSAADQVANLKSGQRVATDNDVVVRLNVQSDPAAAEYAVALNGEAVAADHSTSQYHFYYLPAAQLSAGTATLSVETADALTGEGTADDPYQIYTAAQLAAFRDKVNTSGETGAWATLKNSFSISGYWTPIGTADKPYTGTFDGDGRTISGLNVNVVNSSDGDSAGLFGVADEGAAIKNLTISSGTITINKAGYAGALIGRTKGAVTLTNCHTASSVTVQAGTATASSVGGLVGYSESGLLTMTACSNAAAVTGGAASANKGTGGLVGQAAAAFSIQRSFNAGSVSSAADSNVGGLVGYASGTVTAASALTDVYSAGAVSGTANSSVGGFIGKVDSGFVFGGVTNAYIRADVTAGEGTGYAIVGSATKEIPLDNVYKLDESPEEDIGEYTNDSETTSTTEDDLKTLAGTLSDNWTDDTEAALNDGFPILKWQADGSGEKPVALQGSGTAEDPYQIPDAAALNLFRDKVNEGEGESALYGKLTDDVTLSGTWEPMEVFNGELDGQNHTISGIQINASGTNGFDQGLIRITKGETVIKNLTIAGSSIATTQTRAGAFVGKADDEKGSLTLTNCHTAADVTVSAGTGIAGGLVGQTAGSVTITNCSNAAAVTSTGTSNGIGGLVGHAYNGSGKTLTVSQSFNAGAVTGGKYTGGLVGQVSNDACTLTMMDVYNTGTVSNKASTGAVGSLIGYLSKGWGNKGTTTITNAYSASANALLGKLDASKPTSLSNVYVLTGQNTVGTLADDAELTGAATEKTAAEMQDKTFGKKALGVRFTWDFQSLNSGYPVLKWQNGNTQEPVTLQGAGTAADPYQLWDASDLAAFRDGVNKGTGKCYAILMDDIDLQTEAFTSTWTPIGTLDRPYSGIFDGNGHTISGIQIQTSTEQYSGLFGWTAATLKLPVIKNLTIASSTIINENKNGYAAAIIAFGGGIMENCHTETDVTVKGSNVAGGLVGTFKTAYADEHATMTNCSNRAAVSQTGTPGINSPKIGGLIGYPWSVIMTGCFNAGTVSAESGNDKILVGGLIGYTDQSDSFLTDVYNVGAVTAPNSVSTSIGGLVGYVSKGLDIRNAYQSGTVSNKDGKGGVVGYCNGGSTTPLALLNVYKTGGLPDYAGKSDSAKFTNKGVDVTVEELKGFTSELGMNFVADLTGDKQLNGGLPILDWQDPNASASDLLYISVKDVERKIRLGATGTTNPENPTVSEIDIDCGKLSTNVADTILLAADNSNNNGTIVVGTGLSKDGTITGQMTANNDGILTADSLYFAKHPAKQTRTVYVAYTRDDVTRYYQININRSARSGEAYGANLVEPATSEDAPYTASTYEEKTGYLTGAVDAGYQMFTDGEASGDGITYGMSATSQLEKDGFTVAAKGSDGTQKVTFTRPGRYWATVSSASSTYDRVPLAAWWGSEAVAQKYLDKAKALKEDAVYATLDDELKADFEAAIQAIDEGKSTIGQKLATRDALGAVMTGEYALEAAENQLLNLMDVIAAWKTSPTLGKNMYTALTKLAEKLEIWSVTDITDDASLTAYETNRGYVRAVLQANSLTAINAVLTKAKCGTIAETVVTPAKNVVLWVDKNGQQLTINSSTGSPDPTKPTEITKEYTIPTDGRMERISFELPEDVQAGTSMNSTGQLSGDLVAADGRYTTDNLYFYDQAKSQTKTIYLVYAASDGTNYYYKVTVSRPAKEGLNISGSSMVSETSPLGLMSGTLSSGKAFACMYVYDGATARSGSTMGMLGAAPEWSTDSNALIYAEDTGNTYNDKVYVGRYGWYWVPVSYTEDGVTASGYLPMVARLDSGNASKLITAAQALESSDQYSAIPDAAKAMMAEAIAAVQAQIDENTLNNAVYIDDTTVKQRNYFGGEVRGTDLVEKETNTIIDLTAIFTTWGTNPTLAQAQWEAYALMMAAEDSIHAAKDIVSAADRDSYQALRQDKWTVVHAADTDTIYKVLEDRGLVVVDKTVSIGTAEELKAFAARVKAGETALEAKLTADIDLKNEAWTPIENYAGTFDGAGHTISGLNVSGAAYAGLFAETGAGAVIRNLTIADSTISGKNYAGAFVGYSQKDVTLENCHTAKDVTVNITLAISATRAGGAGGLVGGLHAMTAETDTTQPLINMSQCSNAATVTGTGSSNTKGGIGGLIGTAPNGGTITNSCNTGTVTNGNTGSYAAAGGLVGISSPYKNWRPQETLTLTNVYNAGAVSVGGSGSKFVGGLVGNATWGFDITNAYGTMTVMAGTSYGGVIVGTVANTVNVSNVYSELIRGKTGSDCKVFLSDSAGKMNAVKNNKMWSDTEMPVAAKVLDKLGEAFKADTTGKICGHVNYPVLTWQSEPAPEIVKTELTVSVNGVKKTVELTSEDSSSAASPTELTVDYTNAEGSGYMDRIYVDGGEDIQLGTTLAEDGTLSDKLVKLDAGYTGNSLYFYKTPEAKTQTFKAVWTVDGTARYYTVNVTRAAQPGLAAGPTSSVYDASPLGAGATNGHDEDGFLKTMAWFSMGSSKMRYDGQNIYMDGTAQSGKMALPDWDALKTQSNGMYFAEDSGYAYFARTGRYWLPISYTSDSGEIVKGYTPVYVRLGIDGNFSYYIGKADALDKSAMPADAQTMLQNAIDTVNAARGAVKLNDVKLALNAKGEYVTAGAADSIGITGRDFFGADLYAESLYEQDINTIMDLTDIFSKEDTQQAGYQWQAYQQIMSMSGAIHKALDIKSAADLDRYQTLRQAKWNLLQTTDLDGVNAILTELGLTTIEAPAPEYTLGDVDGDGVIDISDIGEAIRFYRNLKTPTDTQLKAADINGDGVIDVGDIGMMIRYYRGLITEFPNQNS